MKLVTTLALLLLVPQQSPPATARIEGTVYRVNSTEPLSGAKITIVRVNAVTGAALPVLGTAGGGGLGGGPTASAPLPPIPGTAATGPGGQPLAPAPTGPPPPAAIPSVTTESDGKFSLTNLEAGTYRIQIALDGYVRQDYGQRVFPGVGTPLKLNAGEALKDIIVRLTPTGAINGRVTTDDGKPAAGVQLQLVRISYSAAGQKILQIPTRATSNDRGEYRLYWITPGRYYLAAGTPPGNTSPIQPDWYPFVFFPNTMDISRAVVIDVKPGSEALYDVVVPRQHPYSIRGRVVDATSKSPTTAIGISLAFAGIGGSVAYQHYTQSFDPASGNFEIPDIPPGNYIVQVNAPGGTAQVPVQITNADIEKLNIVVSPGVTIQGRVRLVGGGALPSIPTRVLLRRVLPDISNYVGFAPSTQASNEGTFRLDGVLSGEYRAVITPPGDFYVKDVQFGGNDALNHSIEIAESGASDSMLEILISPNVGQLDGVVVDSRSQPAPGVRVVLVPEKNRERSELYSPVTSDQSGRFTMRRLVPGDYRLFAWEAIENNAYFDPDLLKQYELQGIPVHIEESSRLNIEAKLIPADTNSR